MDDQKRKKKTEKPKRRKKLKQKPKETVRISADERQTSQEKKLQKNQEFQAHIRENEYLQQEEVHSGRRGRENEFQQECLCWNSGLYLDINRAEEELPLPEIPDYRGENQLFNFPSLAQEVDERQNLSFRNEESDKLAQESPLEMEMRIKEENKFQDMSYQNQQYLIKKQTPPFCMKVKKSQKNLESKKNVTEVSEIYGNQLQNEVQAILANQLKDEDGSILARVNAIGNVTGDDRGIKIMKTIAYETVIYAYACKFCPIKRGRFTQINLLDNLISKFEGPNKDISCLKKRLQKRIYDVFNTLSCDSKLLVASRMMNKKKNLYSKKSEYYIPDDKCSREYINGVKIKMTAEVHKAEKDKFQNQLKELNRYLRGFKHFLDPDEDQQPRRRCLPMIEGSKPLRKQPLDIREFIEEQRSIYCPFIDGSIRMIKDQNIKPILIFETEDIVKDYQDEEMLQQQHFNQRQTTRNKKSKKKKTKGAQTPKNNEILKKKQILAMFNIEKDQGAGKDGYKLSMKVNRNSDKNNIRNMGIFQSFAPALKKGRKPIQSEESDEIDEERQEIILQQIRNSKIKKQKDLQKNRLMEQDLPDQRQINRASNNFTIKRVARKNNEIKKQENLVEEEQVVYEKQTRKRGRPRKIVYDRDQDEQGRATKRVKQEGGSRRAVSVRKQVKQGSQHQFLRMKIYQQSQSE